MVDAESVSGEKHQCVRSLFLPVMKNTVSRYTGPFVLKLCCQSLITSHSAWIIFSFHCYGVGT